MAFSQISLLPRRSSTWHCCGCLVLSFFVSALAALRFLTIFCASSGSILAAGLMPSSLPMGLAAHFTLLQLLNLVSPPPSGLFLFFFPTKMYFWVHCSSSDLLLSRYLQLLVSSTMPSKPLSQSTSVSYFLKTSLTLPSRQFAACSSHSTYLFFYKLGHLRPV